MKSYYSDAQFVEVLRTFRPAPSFNKEKFQEQLERVAWFYENCKADADKCVTDTRRQNLIGAIGAAARNLRAKIQEADGSSRILKALEEVDAARASRCSRRYRVYLRLQRLQQELEWLWRVADKAAEAIGSDIEKGGNRPDEPRRELILSVADLYRQWAADPREPTGWQADNDRGELLGLLQAVLRPLGVEMSLPALHQAYVRALKAISKRPETAKLK